MGQQTLFNFETKRTQLIIGLPLSRSAKLLLIVLDTISDKDDFCCPPLSRLAERIGCSESTARNDIRECEKAGFLDVEKLPGHTTGYRIEWGAITLEPSKELANVNQYL